MIFPQMFAKFNHEQCAYNLFYVSISEAHDALHNFSCKMLASRKCDECEYKEGEKPLTTNEDS